MISRFSEYIPVSTINNNIENIFLILHDLQLSGNIIPIDPKIKKIFCLTEWHKTHFLQYFSRFSDITHSLNYGIDFTNFTSTNFMKKPFSFIYSSFANRGLLIVLKMWWKIVDKYPNATLDIFTDINNKWVNTYYPEEIQQIRELLDKYSGSCSQSIKIHGWVNKKTLASYWKQSQVWFYPCTFKETFCLTALEAAITKTMVITNDLAGLQETVGNRGIIIPGDSSTIEWQDIALNKIVDYLDNPHIGKNMIEQNYEWALQHSWKQITETFLSNHVENLSKTLVENPTKNSLENPTKNSLETPLNYLEMYNWTNDLPIHSKQIFLQILDLFKEYPICNILEIGTYVGTSVIEMLQYLPNSIATTIDKWENYNENNIDIFKNMESNNVEKIFYDNILKSNVLTRISVLKGDSSTILIKLIKKEKLFNFIYVDGSHKCIDCYTDCLLSWNLLEKNGILAIDDYLYIVARNKDDCNFLAKTKNNDELLIEIKNYPLTDFPKKILVCLKYKSYCGSNVCKEERDENPRHTL
jgi:predicted O-methyltransferase YrrM